MTEEELDLLASSYLDGEATPEEVAMIERDPALLARVEELRVAQSAMRGPVSPPSMALKEDQLASALAAFDATGSPTTVMAVEGAAEATVDAPAATDRIIDLRTRRDQRAQRQAEAAGRMRWLSAVAGVLVFAAGGVFLISQVGGGDDSEFAGDVPAADTAATESAEAQSAPADGATEAEMATADDAAGESAIASEPMDADAEEDFAMEETEAAADAEAADESAADAGSEPTIREFAEEGFFGDEPVATYRSIPTSDELLADFDLPWRSSETAICADQAELPDGAVVVGYLPIEIPVADGDTGAGTQVVEALYLTVGNEEQVVLVDPETCAVI